MKLDEKYFVPFLVIVATAAALLILFFTVNNQQGREQSFKKAMARQDSLKYQYLPLIDRDDSLRVQSFTERYVILDFWATWTSSFSLKAHEQLAQLKKANPDKIEVIAAVVQDKPADVKEYRTRYNFPFSFVDGTRVFNSFGIPGVPTQLVYSPGGRLQSIFTGSADLTRLDSLKTIIDDGR